MAEYKTTVTETEDGGRTITSGNMTEQEAAKLAAKRERTKNMNTSDGASAASDALDKDIAAKKRYTEMQNILALGGHKSMSDEEKEAFVKEYKKLKSDYSFAEGGAVPMNNMAKQMEMFDDGGLMDEGGTVDPVSGNDVPPGSNQEEVRDDIPAQLSEGEFVFPADVVRFIGLEKLMMIRQRAKAGLQRMDDMGQMGNSEEAVMPDDLPFSIDDLDMEDDGLEMAQGGVVQAANGTFVQPTPTTPNAGVFYNPASQLTTGVAAAPMQAASASAAPSIGQAATPVQAGSGKPTMFTNYQLPQAPVPVMTAPDQLPKFLGEVAPGVGGVDYTEETYVNEAGQTIKFRRYNDGSLKDSSGNEAVIPEGYTIKSEAEKDVGTGPVKVETATVQDEGDGGNNDGSPTSGASVSFGGTPARGDRAGLVDGAFKGNLSIETPNAGIFDTISGIKGYMGKGVSSLAFSLTDGKIGEQLTLEPGHRAVISDIVVPGSRTTPLGKDRTLSLDLVLDAKAYKSMMTGTVSSRQELAKVASFVDRYGPNIVGSDVGRVHVNDAMRSLIDRVEEEEKRGNVTESGRFRNQFEANRAEQNKSAANASSGRPDDTPAPTATPGYSGFDPSDDMDGPGDNANDGGGMGNTGSDDTGGATGGGPSSGGTADAGDMD